MSGFYTEWYTGLKWVKRDYSLPQILNLSFPKYFFKEVLLKGAQNQAKVPIHFGNCISGQGQFYALPVMAKG